MNVYKLSDVGRRAFADRYPDVQVQPPVTPTIEPQAFRPTGPPNFELITGVPRLRLWFRSIDSTQLVQFQDDWISCNWQDDGKGDPYPKYHEAIRPFFFDNYGALVNTMTDQGLGAPSPIQCEVTYINHVLRGDLWTGFGEADRVIRAVTRFESFMGDPESLELSMQFPLLDREDLLRGRLHVNLQPALRAADEEPVFVLTLKGRGSPLPGEDGVLEFMDLAHDWIVNGFTELVTTDALNEWGYGNDNT